MQNLEYIEKIFSSKTNNHGYNIFNHEYLNKLVFKKEKKIIKILCKVRKKFFKPGPEEVVRQLEIIKLVDEYKYSLDQILVEQKVVMGSGYAPKKADIIIFKDLHLLLTPINSHGGFLFSYY